jgi:hypothetical protein
LVWREQDAVRQEAHRSKVIPRKLRDEKKRSCLIAAASINCEFRAHQLLERHRSIRA